MHANRSSNFCSMCMKTSKSTVRELGKTSDRPMAEAFFRSRSLRQSLAAVPRFSLSRTHTKSARTRSNSISSISNRCRGAAPAIICSRREMHIISSCRTTSKSSDSSSRITYHCFSRALTLTCRCHYSSRPLRIRATPSNRSSSESIRLAHCFWQLRPYLRLACLCGALMEKPVQA